MHAAYGPRDPKPQQQYIHVCGILWHRKSLWRHMAPWPAIQAIEITFFGKFDKAYWLVPNQQKVQSNGRRRIIHATRNTSRTATRFRPGPYPVQLVYKWSPQIPGVQLTLFADDTSIYATERKKGYVLRKLLAASLQWRGGVSSEHKDQWKWDSGHLVLPYTWTDRGSSHVERTEHSLCKRCKIYRCNFW